MVCLYKCTVLIEGKSKLADYIYLSCFNFTTYLAQLQTSYNIDWDFEQAVGIYKMLTKYLVFAQYEETQCDWDFEQAVGIYKMLTKYLV